MTKHAKLSPSGADRWFNCPASIKLCEGLPQEAPNKYMLEGTRAHEFAEKVLLGEMTIDQVPEEFREAINLYISYINTLREHYSTSEIYVEQKVKLPGTEIFGTCDCVIRTDYELFVIDYKHGAGVSVDIEDNKQLLIYALGVLAFFNEYEYSENIKSICIAIVQPRARDESPKIKTCYYTHSRLMFFKQQLQEAITKVKQENPNIVQGDHCRFCRAKAICPKYYDQVVDVAKTEFKDVGAKLPAIETLSAQDIIKVLDHAEDIGKWISSVQNHAKALLEQGGLLDGYKLVQKRTNRKWVDESDFISKFNDSEYKYLIFEDPKLKSVAKMSKLIPDAKLKEFYHNPEGEITIVPESDKRRAVSNSALLDFKDIEI